MKFFVFLLFLNISLFSQEFQLENVLPENCLNGKFQCGYKPTSEEILRAVPLSRSSYIKHRGLPSSVDLSHSMPPVGNQGRQGSCVAWATAYALKSYQEKIEKNWNYDIEWYWDKEWLNNNSFLTVYKPRGSMQHVFSPAFVYNQINKGVDNGSYIGDALELLINKGVPPLAIMPYNEKDYLTKPNSIQFQEAAKYKAKKYYHIKPKDIGAIKVELAKGNPVVFGMKLYENFSKLKKEVYDSLHGAAMGGHAMTLVGYDDNKTSQRGYKGAFKFINSWGHNWGDNGYGWVSYRIFAALTHDAWVLEDLVETSPNVIEEIPTLESPKNVQASKGTYSNKIVISWNKVEIADAYLIKKYLNEELVDQILVSENFYEDTEVELDFTYQYTVLSIQYIDEEEYKYSDESTAQIAEGYISNQQEKEIEQVIGVKLELNEKQEIKISWEPLKNAKTYEVFKYDPRLKDWKKLFSTPKTNGLDKNPTKGENNYYAVRGIQDSIFGPWSETVKIFVEFQNTIPSKITDLRATYGKIGGITLFWSKSQQAQKYHIIQHDLLKNKSLHIGTVENNLYFDSSKLATSEILVGYSVIPENQAGKGEISNMATGLGISSSFFERGVPILPPTEVGYKLQANQFHVTWKNVENAHEYYVYLKNPNSKKWEFLTSTGKKTEYIFSVPEKNKLFALAIKSKAELGGESTFSKPILLSIGESKKLPKHRFLPEAGIQNFTGQWLGSFFDEKGKPTDIYLDITNNGNQFTAIVNLDKQITFTYSGTYKTLANFLKTKNFYLEAPTHTKSIPDLLILKLTNPLISKKTIALNVIRE